MAEHFPDFQKKVDYISLDSVCLNKHVFYHPKDGIARNNGYDPADWAIRISDVMDVPAADVVEVVRCKDCINWNGNDCVTLYGLYAPRPNDYCSRGEKNSG